MREHSWAEKWARTVVVFTMSADYSTHPLALQPRTYLARRIASKLVGAFRVGKLIIQQRKQDLAGLGASPDFETCCDLDYLCSVVKDSLLMTHPFSYNGPPELCCPFRLDRRFLQSND